MYRLIMQKLSRRGRIAVSLYYYNLRFMIRTIVKTMALCVSICSALYAQDYTQSPQMDSLMRRVEALERKAERMNSTLKVSGYIQAQAQYGEQDARFRVGGNTPTLGRAEGRIGIRRGHLKFDYASSIGQAVLQLDITDRKVALKDAYFEMRYANSPLGQLGMRLGVFDRPFGYEISYSSAERESPERAYIFPELFPSERDLGGMLIWQPKKGCALDFLKLEAGFFAGNGIQPEIDGQLDFIGHLSAEKELSSILNISGGLSYYHGFVQHTQNKYWDLQDHRFRAMSVNEPGASYALRQYFGLDAQLALKTGLGKTELRAEYLWGMQPSPEGSFKSPNSSKLHTTPLYLRPFSGGYVILVQGLGRLPLSAVFKYDWLDPNTNLSVSTIAAAGGSKLDVARSALGLGALWQINKQVRLQAYYDIVRNELDPAIKGYEVDRKDNLLTMTLQYRF